MASLAAVLDPGMFILGGGLSTAGELLREPAMRALQERITAQAYREVPTVRIAELGPAVAVAVGENGTAVGQGTAWDTEDGGGGSDERARFVQ